MNDDIRIADELLNDVWEIFKKIGDYGAFRSFEDLRQTTGYTHWDLKELMKKLDLPEQKFGDHKEGLVKVAYLRGRLYAMMPEYKKAIEQYEKALQFDSTDDWRALIKYYMGIAHQVFDKKEPAIECFETVKNLVGLDEEIGMDSAKRIEELKAEKVKKSGCFVATAAYGSPDCTEVMLLRAFRDDVLLKSSLGSRFVSFYYAVSPGLAKIISANGFLRYVVRGLILRPVVSACNATLNRKYRHKSG